MQTPRVTQPYAQQVIFEVGDHVHVDVQEPSDSDGRIIGFYVGETPRVLVALRSGEQLIAPESDLSLV